MLTHMFAFPTKHFVITRQTSCIQTSEVDGIFVLETVTMLIVVIAANSLDLINFDIVDINQKSLECFKVSCMFRFWFMMVVRIFSWSLLDWSESFGFFWNTLVFE